LFRDVIAFLWLIFAKIKMIGVVIAGHGDFPKSLVSTAERILGKLENVLVVSTKPGEEPFHLCERLDKAVEKVASEEGVLVLTDVFGSSASSMCINMAKNFPVKVVTGVNLPMIFTLATYRNSKIELDTLASKVEEKGKKSITNW
jgi:PTS system mannose-specific IIA component